MKLTPLHIVDTVADFYQVSTVDLLSRSRQQPLAYYRQVAMWTCRTCLDVPLSTLSAVFDRDHSTILHAFERIKSIRLNPRDPLYHKVTAETDQVMGRLRKELYDANGPVLTPPPIPPWSAHV